MVWVCGKRAFLDGCRLAPAASDRLRCPQCLAGCRATHGRTQV